MNEHNMQEDLKHDYRFNPTYRVLTELGFDKKLLSGVIRFAEDHDFIDDVVTGEAKRSKKLNTISLKGAYQAYAKAQPSQKGRVKVELSHLARYHEQAGELPELLTSFEDILYEYEKTGEPMEWGHADVVIPVSAAEHYFGIRQASLNLITGHGKTLEPYRSPTMTGIVPGNDKPVKVIQAKSVTLAELVRYATKSCRRQEIADSIKQFAATYFSTEEVGEAPEYDEVSVVHVVPARETSVDYRKAALTVARRLRHMRRELASVRSRNYADQVERLRKERSHLTGEMKKLESQLAQLDRDVLRERRTAHEKGNALTEVQSLLDVTRKELEAYKQAEESEDDVQFNTETVMSHNEWYDLLIARGAQPADVNKLFTVAHWTANNGDRQYDVHSLFVAAQLGLDNEQLANIVAEDLTINTLEE